MGMRMSSIDVLFGKLPRVIRDVATLASLALSELIKDLGERLRSEPPKSVPIK
jgi:hypothetical protein